jgi:hypothetical protein
MPAPTPNITTNCKIAYSRAAGVADEVRTIAYIRGWPKRVVVIVITRKLRGQIPASMRERVIRSVFVGILGLNVRHDLDIEPATRSHFYSSQERLFGALGSLTERLQSSLSVRIPPAPPPSLAIEEISGEQREMRAFGSSHVNSRSDSSQPRSWPRAHLEHRKNSAARLRSSPRDYPSSI